jgi:NACalpha-BTF3-like transcription factor
MTNKIKYYATTDNSEYTSEQINNHNRQIDLIAENYNVNRHTIDDDLKNFQSDFCNSISEQNKNGKTDLYKKYI